MNISKHNNLVHSCFVRKLIRCSRETTMSGDRFGAVGKRFGNKINLVQ